MKYQQPYGVTDTNAPYINGNPVAGIQGSIPPAGAFEENQRELINYIMLSGFTPSGGDRVAGGDLYQVSKAAQSQKVNFAIDTGTQNAIKALVQPALGAYFPGLIVRTQVLFSNINDGSHTTMTLDAGAGAAPVIKNDGSMPVTNDMKAGGLYEFVFDGSKWQMINFGGAGAGGGTTTTVNVKIPYCRDTGVAANAMRAIYSPAITAVAEGDFIAIKLAFSLVTGACSITINGLAPMSVKHPDGTNMTQGDAVAGQTLLLCYDGAAWQIIGAFGTPSVIRPRLLYSTPEGGNQSVPVTVITRLTQFSLMMQNTMVTSTFTGNAMLTIGAGEDGLWQFDGYVGWGNLTTSHACYLFGIRHRSGQNDLVFQSGYNPYAAIGVGGAPSQSDTGINASGHVELLVGDQVDWWCAIWASGGPWPVKGPGNNTPLIAPTLNGHLVSRHLI